MNCPKCKKHRLRFYHEVNYTDKKTGAIIKTNVIMNCPKCGKMEFEDSRTPKEANVH